MSFAQSPGGYTESNAITPNYSSSDYFSAWKQQSSIPVLFIEKLTMIVEDYFKLLPKLKKREMETEILFKYNTKLLETVNEFIGHQKKIVDKCNALSAMYIKSFEKYCAKKHWDVNFTSLQPMKSLFQNFTMKDWTFETKETFQVQIETVYHEKLFNSIKKHFLLNNSINLEEQLTKITHLKGYKQLPEDKILEIQEIKLSISQYGNKIKFVTSENMFDVLDLRKRIESQIKQLQIDNEIVFNEISNRIEERDRRYIEEVMRIHAKIEKVDEEEIKRYLGKEKEIRKKLKKFKLKEQQKVQIFHENLEHENNQFREEKQNIEIRLKVLETQNLKMKSQLEYLSLRQNVSGSRRSPVHMNSSVLLQENFKSPQTPREDQNAKKNQILSNELKQLKMKHQEIKKLFDEEKVKNLQEIHQNAAFSLIIKQNEKKSSAAQELSEELKVRIKDLEELIVGKYQNIRLNLTNLSQTAGGVEMLKIIFDYFEDKIKFSSGRYNFSSEQEKGSESPSAYNIRVNEERVFPAMLHSISERKSEEDSFRTPKTPRNGNDALEKEKMQEALSEEKRQNSRLKNQIQTLRKQIKKLNEHISFLEKKSKDLNQELLEIKIKNIDQEKSIGEMQVYDKSDNLHEDKYESWLASIENQQCLKASQIQLLCKSLAKAFEKMNSEEFLQIAPGVEEAVANMKIVLQKVKSTGKYNMQKIPILSKLIGDKDMDFDISGETNFKILENELKLKKQLLEYKLIEDKGQVSPSIRGRMSPDRTSLLRSSNKLSLRSELVHVQINLQKSLYFGKQRQSQEACFSQISKDEDKSKVQLHKKIYKNHLNDKESSEDDMIEIVSHFVENKRPKDQIIEDSQNSLKFSKSNIKGSQEGLDQSDGLKKKKWGKKIVSETDKKMLSDMSLLHQIQKQIQHLKENHEEGSDFYWLYHRYKKALEALGEAEKIIKQNELQKEKYFKQMSTDKNLQSQYKLEEKIYFLQKKIREQQIQMREQRQQFEKHIVEKIREIEELTEKVLNNYDDNLD